MQHSELVFDMI